MHPIREVPETETGRSRAPRRYALPSSEARRPRPRLDLGLESTKPKLRSKYNPAPAPLPPMHTIVVVGFQNSS